MPTTSYADYLARWQQLVSNTTANLESGELPELMEPYRVALEEVMEQVEERRNDLQLRRSATEKEQKDLDVLKRKGRFHSSKLVSLLIGHYGLDNPRLKAYGIKPRKTKLQPASETEEPEPETPPAPPVEIEALETAKAPEAAEPSPTPEAKPAP